MLYRSLVLALALLVLAAPGRADPKDLSLVPDASPASAAPEAPASPAAAQEPFSPADPIWPSPEPDAPAATVAQPAPPSAAPPDPGISLKARIDRTGEVAVGETISVTVQPAVACYVYILCLGTSGQSDLLFPNKKETDNHFTAGQERTIPGPTAGYKVKVSGPAGTESVIVLASARPLDVYQHLALIAPRKQAEALTLVDPSTVLAQKDLTLVATPPGSVHLDDFFAALERSGQIAARKDIAHTILTLTVK